MKTALFLILLFFISFINCYSQPKNVKEGTQVNKQLTDSFDVLTKKVSVLEKNHRFSDSVVKHHFNSLTSTLDSTKKSINDTRLRESLKSAENTINFQDSFIQIFGVIFVIIAFFAGFLYFFSIKPLAQQADKALDRANSATDKFEKRIYEFDKKVDNKINSQFKIFKDEEREREINEIFKDIESNREYQRRLQIERLSRGDINLTSERIDQLFKVLDSSTLSEYEKLALIETLTQINNYQIQKYFALWDNVNKEERKINDFLFIYYINNDIEKFLGPISHFILNRIDPHLEFNRLIDIIPSSPDCIFTLINSKSLIDALSDQSKQSVINHIDESIKMWVDNKEIEKVEGSYLYVNFKSKLPSPS